MAFVSHQNQNLIIANIFEYSTQENKRERKKTIKTKQKKKKKVLHSDFSVSGMSQSVIKVTSWASGTWMPHLVLPDQSLQSQTLTDHCNSLKFIWLVQLSVTLAPKPSKNQSIKNGFKQVFHESLLKIGTLCEHGSFKRISQCL